MMSSYIKEEKEKEQRESSPSPALTSTTSTAVATAAAAPANINPANPGFSFIRKMNSIMSMSTNNKDKDQVEEHQQQQQQQQLEEAADPIIPGDSFVQVGHSLHSSEEGTASTSVNANTNTNIIPASESESSVNKKEGAEETALKFLRPSPMQTPILNTETDGKVVHQECQDLEGTGILITSGHGDEFSCTSELGTSLEIEVIDNDDCNSVSNSNSSDIEVETKQESKEGIDSGASKSKLEESSSSNEISLNTFDLQTMDEIMGASESINAGIAASATAAAASTSTTTTTMDANYPRTSTDSKRLRIMGVFFVFFSILANIYSFYTLRGNPPMQELIHAIDKLTKANSALTIDNNELTRSNAQLKFDNQMKNSCVGFGNDSAASKIEFDSCYLKLAASASLGECGEDLSREAQEWYGWGVDNAKSFLSSFMEDMNDTNGNGTRTGTKNTNGEPNKANKSPIDELLEGFQKDISQVSDKLVREAQDFYDWSVESIKTNMDTLNGENTDRNGHQGGRNKNSGTSKAKKSSFDVGSIFEEIAEGASSFFEQREK
uniref:Uncharacterized protein n=1 Tax=Chaetoceros debilis TaxID=122233 RepID=A0A7S3VAA7_9STRA